MGAPGAAAQPAREAAGGRGAAAGPPGLADFAEGAVSARRAPAEMHLSPSDVATRLGVDRSSVFRWINSGQLGPVVKLGRRTLRIPESALLRFLEQRRV